MASPRPRRTSPRPPPRVVVLGDVMVDVVMRPASQLKSGTDVPGRIEVRAGGSAANTARWLARLGTRVTLIASVGRDPAGRALAASLRAEGVRLHLARPSGVRTGRIGVLVSLDGERAFVADRGAANELRAADVRSAWLSGVRLLHLPAYSLLAKPLDGAARRALELARAAGALVSVDLASTGPLLASGRPVAMRLLESVAPDLLFATAAEASALVGAGSGDADGFRAAEAELMALAPTVALKRAAAGATVLARDAAGRVLRLDVPARATTVTDSTGAGDAFDAGFIAAWLDGHDKPAPALPSRSRAATLRRATLAGHRAAARQLAAGLPELPLL